MSTISHPPTGTVSDTRHWSARVVVTEMWASLAIVAMWVSVAVATVWGPDFVSSDGAGTNDEEYSVRGYGRGFEYSA